MSELPELPPISKREIRSLTNILTGINKKDGSSLVTKEQADTLAKLRFQESGEQILTLEDRPFLYENVWLLQSDKVGYEGTYNFLTTNWEKILGKHNVRKKMLFENPLLSSEREKFLVDMEIFRGNIDVEKSEVECRKCRGSNVITISKQILSSDEAMTHFYVCNDCKNKWQAN